VKESEGKKKGSVRRGVLGEKKGRPGGYPIIGGTSIRTEAWELNSPEVGGSGSESVVWSSRGQKKGRSKKHCEEKTEATEGS